MAIPENVILEELALTVKGEKRLADWSLDPQGKRVRSNSLNTYQILEETIGSFSLSPNRETSTPEDLATIAQTLPPNPADTIRLPPLPQEIPNPTCALLRALRSGLVALDNLPGIDSFPSSTSTHPIPNPLTLDLEKDCALSVSAVLDKCIDAVKVPENKLEATLRKFRYTVPFTDDELDTIKQKVPSSCVDSIINTLQQYQNGLETIDKSFLYWVLTFSHLKTYMAKVNTAIMTLATSGVKLVNQHQYNLEQIKGIMLATNNPRSCFEGVALRMHQELMNAYKKKCEAAITQSVLKSPITQRIVPTHPPAPWNLPATRTVSKPQPFPHRLAFFTESVANPSSKIPGGRTGHGPAACWAKANLQVIVRPDGQCPDQKMGI